MQGISASRYGCASEELCYNGNKLAPNGFFACSTCGRNICGQYCILPEYFEPGKYQCMKCADKIKPLAVRNRKEAAARRAKHAAAIAATAAMDCPDGLGSPEEAKEEDSDDVHEDHEGNDEANQDQDGEERPDGLDSPVQHIPNGVAVPVQDQDPDIQLINQVQDE